MKLRLLFITLIFMSFTSTSFSQDFEVISAQVIEIPKYNLPEDNINRYYLHLKIKLNKQFPTLQWQDIVFSYYNTNGELLSERWGGYDNHYTRTNPIYYHYVPSSSSSENYARSREVKNATMLLDFELISFDETPKFVESEGNNFKLKIPGFDTMYFNIIMPN